MKIFPLLPTRLAAIPQTRDDERKLREYDSLEGRSDVVVTAVFPKLEIVVARTENQNIEVHLVDKVPGVHWKEVPTGQHLRVRFVGVLAPLVVSVETA